MAVMNLKTLITIAITVLPLPLRSAETIDRHALVTRHHPVNRAFDPDSTLSVGNGGFAFGVDITGLQTFDREHHLKGIPVETLSRWCWHSAPNPQGHDLAAASKTYLQGDGRKVDYPTEASIPAGDWLRKNPHHMPLGRIRFVTGENTELVPADIASPEQTLEQTLELWTGVLSSRFDYHGMPVEVTTACNPKMDLIAVRIKSKALAEGSLKVEMAFPRGHDLAIKNNPPLDWSQPDSHDSHLLSNENRRADIRRSIDATSYHVAVCWNKGVEFVQAGRHQFVISNIGGNDELACTFAFAPERLPAGLPDVDGTLQASAAHWKAHWLNGAMVDFSGSTDPRAAMIEKRMILSQFLMASQMAGETPPQESGLVCGTWYGKHHSEMIWWHSAHFALWGRDELLKKNLDWYLSRLPEARSLAKSRGLNGARWAKMTGPDGRESPGGNPLIIWNQPHLVHLCELLRRNDPGNASNQRYQPLVLETAECLASMAWQDDSTRNYHLGPPLWIAQEIYDPATSRDPSFELSYWRWALQTAQAWRERLGMPREPQWDEVIRNLAPIPQKDGLYVALASHPDTFDNITSRHDHPTMLAPLGLLPGDDVDRATMNRTLDAVLAHWDWKTKIWGWDYPMIAMTATRLGRPADALEILLRQGPNNIYLPNGHCPQRVDESAPNVRRREIPVYLPANGAFLSALALMVAGWDSCEKDYPGFPDDGTWKIRAEGLKRMP